MTTRAMVNCVIVDDEELARELIETHLGQLNQYHVVASCASAIEASTVLKQHDIDLLFLDIEMPVLKGTEFYKNLVRKPKVIFTTAYRGYALDGFELDAVDYLLKPIAFSRFFKAIERFETSHQVNELIGPSTLTDKPSSLFVRKDRKQVKVTVDEILYVQSLKDYIKIVMHDDSHVVKQSISAFEQELGENFMRIHRSYIVNRDKITAYTSHDIEIGDLEIPIGDRYRERFKATFVKSL